MPYVQAKARDSLRMAFSTRRFACTAIFSSLSRRGSASHEECQAHDVPSAWCSQVPEG